MIPTVLGCEYATTGMGKNPIIQVVGAGMYFYSIQTGQFRQTRKMILFK